MTNQPSKVKFQYVVPDGYEPKYANSAFGGVTPKNEIVVNFLHERTTLPKSEVHPVSPGGQLGPPEQSAQDTVTIERHVVTGVVMSEVFARELYAWLTEKLEQVRLQREAQRIVAPGSPSH